jgi:hypothetical protein
MDPSEQIDLTLDFVNDAARCDAVASATWTVAVVSGTDASYATRAIGDPTWCGQSVTQRMGTLLTGVKYKVTALATMNSGEILGLYSHVTGKS